MATVASVCLDVFLLGIDFSAEGRSGDGYGFEDAVAHHLSRRGVSIRGQGATRVVGPQSLSGLRHQIDAQGDVGDGLLIGEWKTYRGTIPKNDLLRFHAVTEDYWLLNPRSAGRPVFRFFGGTGRITPAARRFAARWGICLITPDTWPALTIADPTIAWPEGDGPTEMDRQTIAWLARPMQSVYRTTSAGRLLLPAPVDDATLEARLLLHDHWSESAWQWWFDRKPSRFAEIANEASTARPRLAGMRGVA
jgi:hypothetical protein